jgi:hypothetical protein
VKLINAVLLFATQINDMRALSSLSSLLITILLSLKVRQSHSLTAQELTIGDWDVTLSIRRCRLGGEPASEVLFPNLIPSSHQSSVERPRRVIDCRLSIYANGTFSLVPKNEECRVKMHGYAELGPNPYCPTDRFYDDLCLLSYPRVQKTQDKVLQRVSFQLKCRLYGRYRSSMKRIGRMNHGVMIWQGETPSERPRNLWGWWKRRRVCATFVGRPGVSDAADTSHDDDEL